MIRFNLQIFGCSSASRKDISSEQSCHKLVGHLILETENVMANAVLLHVISEFTIISRKESRSEPDLWSRDAYHSISYLLFRFWKLMFLRICFLMSKMEKFQKFTSSSVTYFLDTHEMSLFYY